MHTDIERLANVGVIAATVLASGCAHRVADLTVGSTKNYNINSASFLKGDRVIGEDIVAVVLFPLGIPHVKTAVDDAIEKDRCAVGLTDLVITSLQQAFLVGRIGFRVEGNLIIDQEIDGCSGRA
ncbi:hypothetical protein [Marinobacter sp.]|uniref:hypothetical protein n=1 Tax=Marinobacter sp. TaxID=50741 RepID=UPI003A959F61